MNLISAYLVIAVVLFSTSWVQSSPCSAYRELAAQEAMKKCNIKIKRCYLLHQDVVPEKLYCKGMMALLKCAYRERKDLGCRSAAFDRWMFVVLQYVAMGMPKWLGICTAYAKENEKQKVDELIAKVENNAKFAGKGITNINPGQDEIECACEIHRTCLKIMVKGSAEGKINLCKDVEEFLKCYQDEIGRPRQCVVPYISKKFNQIIQVASGGSEGLITEYEQNPQQFCFADDSEPESEDCLE
ncbi:hypothetical protein OS493_009933 [Desmophyllum pertusum]|uniref:Uncharacterized protein n=1 Tax=Desmophyllum pertusum TaxID=174260 RepID=A0A9W9YHE4_9CNID|nr:hypothetical protein OS493_009933 [Desmophyllum pertusum]